MKSKSIDWVDSVDVEMVQCATDTITVDPAKPFGTAQTSGTCYIK